MYIGAIVTIAGESRAEAGNSAAPVRRTSVHPGVASQLLLGSPVAFWDVLGQNILDRTLGRLRRFGIEQISVISENTACGSAPRSHYNSLPHDTKGENFWSAWDSVVSQYLNHGIEMLLLVRLGPYVELDVPDFVRFHRETSSPLTQVYDRQGALDLVMVDTAQLQVGDGSCRSRLSTLIPQRRRYRFSGYSNRLSHAADFRRLVQDAFLGRCAIQPAGRQIQPDIWVGDNVFIDDSARIHGPAYIGAGSRIGTSCTVAGLSTIEQRCEVDCGTTVDSCCILPGTYVGMGLNVRNSLLAGSTLFNLARNVEVKFNDRRLIANTLPSRNLVAGATSLFRRPVRNFSNSGLSTRFTQVASLMTHRWLAPSGNLPAFFRSPRLQGWVKTFSGQNGEASNEW